MIEIFVHCFVRLNCCTYYQINSQVPYTILNGENTFSSPSIVDVLEMPSGYCAWMERRHQHGIRVFLYQHYDLLQFPAIVIDDEIFGSLQYLSNRYSWCSGAGVRC